MAQYRISGVWKTDNGVITHYALHKPSVDGYFQAEKTTKDQVIRILGAGHTVKTWVWNYTKTDWVDGQAIHVVDSGSNRYLRTAPDGTIRDNLDNLINAEWFKL